MSARLAIVLFVSLAGACAAIAGLEEPTRDGPIARPDAAADVTASDTRPACRPGGEASDGKGRLHAVRADVAPEIDGRFDDWACADKMAIGAGDRARDGIPATSTADVAIMWDAVHLYFWARVTVQNPSNTASADIYINDSVHLFLAADGPAQDYRGLDHQLVFDVRKQVADFGDVPPTRRGTGNGVRGVRAMTSDAIVSGNQSAFEVEVVIDAGVIGRTSFASGERVRVNFQVNDGAPGSTTGYRTWFHDPASCVAHIGCAISGTSEPYCDPRCTGEVELR